MKSAVLFAALFSIATAAPAQVTHYHADITPDVQNASVRGTVTLTVAQDTTQLELDAGALEIASVTEDGKALPFSRSAGKLRIEMPLSHAARTLILAYAGKPRYGMHFTPEAQQVFTVFSTSEWMPVIDAPSNRAGFTLQLNLPDGVQAVGNGERCGVNCWSQQRPMPSYLFGFASGDYREVIDPGTVTLRYLAPKTFSEAELRKIFAASRDMLAFYQDKAGLPYPGKTYTQVLVHGGAAQEADGFSLMGEKYGRRVLEDEGAIWLGAHEFAHQWWGNGLTNRDWTHFWLNEGIATFMTAAYLEHRFGRAEYLRQIDAARAKVEKLRAAGKEKSLVFPDWDKPSPDDRSLVYDKGALVLHQLRELLGEEKFWPALRSYTQNYWGKSVTTSDFKSAMEASSGVDLSAFFNQHVLLRQ